MTDTNTSETKQPWDVKDLVQQINRGDTHQHAFVTRVLPDHVSTQGDQCNVGAWPNDMRVRIDHANPTEATVELAGKTYVVPITNSGMLKVPTDYRPISTSAYVPTGLLTVAHPHVKGNRKERRAKMKELRRQPPKPKRF